MKKYNDPDIETASLDGAESYSFDNFTFDYLSAFSFRRIKEHHELAISV
jgi:hypothetical protein